MAEWGGGVVRGTNGEERKKERKGAGRDGEGAGRGRGRVYN